MVAVNMLAEAIRSGRVSLGLAGGSESMSRPTLTLRHSAEKFFLKLARARTMPDKIKALASFKFSHLLPQAPSPKEPSTGLTMGEHCEIMAKEFGISRAAQDALALQSHQHAAAAQSKGYLAEEIASLPGIDKDNIIRGDTTIERLSKLPAVFDRSPAGTLSAGNSSALTDGASVVCLMAEDRAKIEGRAILGYIEETEFAAISPKDGLLMAPAVAVPNLMKRAGLRIADIDLFEIHEAFAAQVLCNMHAWERGWSKYPAAQAIGVIPPEKVNVNGGSLALGHPFAATGGRLILAALSELRRRGKSKAAISVCAAGAMGCAMLVSSR
ncbi:MAG: acetyl-CoA C-acyltransferase [Proteobacteria bacterium]|nr:MAG: acetyl-CoA C-acyltransferase [Pseudomonadota bacterium]